MTHKMYHSIMKLPVTLFQKNKQEHPTENITFHVYVNLNEKSLQYLSFFFKTRLRKTEEVSTSNLKLVIRVTPEVSIGYGLSWICRFKVIETFINRKKNNLCINITLSFI